MPRPIAELSEVEDPAWPALSRAIVGAPMRVQVLPLDRANGKWVLERLQVTARSVLGALALECGGLLVDHGWVRILGGGADGIPDLATANGLGDAGSTTDPPGLLHVAHDVLGGRFAIDGGALGVAPGQVCYFAPDSLGWEGLGVGHGDFVGSMIGGGSAQFYEGHRWPGWEEETTALPLTHGFSLWPPPFSVEGRNVSAASRRVVPLAELFDFYDDVARQLGD